VARYLIRLAVVAAVAAIAIPVGTASAGGGLLGGLTTSLLGGGCGTDTQPFAQFGDLGSYYFAPNGGFEQGSTGWTLAGGAAVVPGSETYAVHSAGDGYSAAIPAGGSVSTNLCYGLLYPNLRFFVADTDGGTATVHVRIVAHSLLGILSVFDGGTFQVSGGWQPSPRLSTLLSALAAPLGTKSLTLQISVDGGSVQVDDLFVDPLMHDS
jgi:hypothetical protein